VQFHWWEYEIPGYLDALGWLADLRRAGKVRNIGTTNFDTERICARIVAAGIPLATNQLQWSCSIARPSAASRTSAAATASRFSATARLPAASSPSAGSVRPIPRRRSPIARSSSTG
jgi:aryl-alcohol dehydrogenase-like predicted oxidoreductase